jgi:hypothetical protein
LYCYRQDFDVQVDAVEQRTAQFARVPLDDHAGAAHSWVASP